MGTCTASELVSVAASQIGYREGKNNNNKFGVAYGWNNVAWCVIFVWWCYYRLGASELFYNGNKTASCTAVYNWAKKSGLLVSWNNAKKGDLVLFKFSSNPPDHIGIIESAGGTRLTTIEGNTSSGNAGSQANGDGVYRRYRYKSQVYAIIRPKYKAVEGSYKTVKVELPLLKKGAKSAAVGTLQTLLNARGFNCGAIDKDYGSNTYKAVLAFQKSAGLIQDGEVGAATWGALLTK